MSERKAAPQIEIGHSDPRSELLSKLDAKDPEFVHAYGPANMTPAQLSAGDFEVVKGKNGEPITHIGDIVVRKPRKIVQANFEAQATQSRKQVEAVVEPEVSTVFANPKKRRE